MPGSTSSLPPRSRFVIGMMYSGAAVVMLLVSFRILTGWAYQFGWFVAMGLVLFGVVLNFRWMAKTR